MWQKKVETIPNFQNCKNSLTNHIQKICHMAQTWNHLNKETHANGNNSYKKPFTIHTEQIFSCYLKTMTGKLPSGRLPPTNSLMGRVRMGGNLWGVVGGGVDLPGGKFPSTMKVKATRKKYCQDIILKKWEFC